MNKQAGFVRIWQGTGSYGAVWHRLVGYGRLGTVLRHWARRGDAQQGWSPRGADPFGLAGRKRQAGFGRRCWLRLVVGRQSVATLCVALRRWPRQGEAGKVRQAVLVAVRRSWQSVAATCTAGTASSGSCWKGVAASSRQAWFGVRFGGICQSVAGRSRQGQSRHRSARSLAVRLGAERQGRHGGAWPYVPVPAGFGKARRSKAGSDRKGRVDQCSIWQRSARQAWRGEAMARHRRDQLGRRG